MQIARKMLCLQADNAVGGTATVTLVSNGIHHPQERAVLNLALGDSSNHFKTGAVYGFEIWHIADSEKELLPPDMR